MLQQQGHEQQLEHSSESRSFHSGTLTNSVFIDTENFSILILV
jgi:hypothetical protein